MLIIIRHGSYSLTTGFLDDIGIQQANQIAELLKRYPRPSSVFHSPTPRTSQTAHIIANHVYAETAIDLSLSEQANPSQYLPSRLENTTTVIVTHLPVIRKLLGAWTEEFGLSEIDVIPIASVFVINPTERTIQFLAQSY